jgi:hypothetical protein
MAFVMAKEMAASVSVLHLQKVFQVQPRPKPPLEYPRRHSVGGWIERIEPARARGILEAVWNIPRYPRDIATNGCQV